MENTQAVMDSGLLELYVLGECSLEETLLIEEMAAKSPTIRLELDAIARAIEAYSNAEALVPDPSVKAFLMATIDYTERLKNGEAVTFPPALSEDSKIEDFEEWTSRPDICLPENLQEYHAKIIGYTPQMVTAVVWINNMAPQEVHNDEYEKFLVLEGECIITIDEEVHPLSPGDFLAIPLHKVHSVLVTSPFPCKVILQRMSIAA